MTSKLPQAKPGIDQIAIYVPGKSAVPEGVQLYKLSSNESPIGPSQRAMEAYAQSAGTLEYYPDGSSSGLREAIGAVHSLNPDNIICGNGSDEILSLLANAYLGPGDEAIYSEYGFLMYRIATLAVGATPIIAPETNYQANVDAILERVTANTKLVFLANPNNPTGTYLPIQEVRRLHAGLPTNVVLVLDAAYAEYVHEDDYEAGIELVSSNQNVVMTRTFSKIFGLAALRIGWAYGPNHIMDSLNRIRGPFNVNAAAIAAGTAAIRDQDHIDRSVAYNDEWLPKISDALTGLGLKVTPSVGNFLLVHFSDTEGKTAADADRYLSARGYVLRGVGGYGLPGALRMTIGNEEANLGVIAALGEFLGADQ